MPFFVAFIAGLIVGGASIAYVLSKRWKDQAEEVKEALNEMAKNHQKEKDDNKQLKQELADMKYQLGEAQKDLAAAKKP